MKYKFKTYQISKSKYFDVEIEEDKYSTLNNFTDISWTPQKAQEIIDGVKSTINSDKEYKWANEDIMFVSHPVEGVIFWDTLSWRGKVNEKPHSHDLVLSHNAFITFMKDFKKFIEENR